LENSLQIIIQGCKREDLQSQQQLYKHFYPVMIKICFRYAGDADGAGSIYNNAMLKVLRISVLTVRKENWAAGLKQSW